MKRWRCECCSIVSDEATLLRGPSPFNPDDELIGCPSCKSTEGFSELCEIDGCPKEATCGGTFKDGVYRRTCFDHAEWIHKKGAA